MTWRPGPVYPVGLLSSKSRSGVRNIADVFFLLFWQNLRVRTLKGAGLALSFGKLPGSLSSKYMLVDGEKVLFGSYR